MQTDQDLITVTAAAARLRVNRRTIQEMVRLGKLDRVFTAERSGPHRCYLITVASLKRWQANKLKRSLEDL